MNDLPATMTRSRAPSPSLAWLGRSPLLLFLTVLCLLPGLGGCHRKEVVHVSLLPQPPPGRDPRRFEIRAQVAGVQAGLRYKWVAELGECDPQESGWPSTMFRFSENASRDRVTVEVWRDNERLAHEQIVLDAAQPRVRTPSQPLPVVQVEITSVPAYEPHGGPNTRADIAGKVSGEIAPEHRVVLYARADEAWYVQPSPYVFETIRPDNTWSTWTHTGSHYAALVVRPGFTPVIFCDVLPLVGGDVLARVIVEGTKK